MVAGQRRYQTDQVTAAEITSICHTVQDPEKYQGSSFQHTGLKVMIRNTAVYYTVLNLVLMRPNLERTFL